MTSQDYAITASNIGKKYRIGKKESYLTMRDTLVNLPKKIFSSKEKKSDFWALKNVSFEIKKGEVVGIIGKNGSGKSTLLKILTRITEPTTGIAKVKGRVASLLEVGTGFNPELTGRENIFLNGSILGMTNKEIRNKFDNIVKFSGITKFLDTPVKRYSSGMYVRLAFSVAAHLESEILLVDEVLAVGDAAFQKKCLGKMEDASRSGRTVFFVSHNMTTVKQLCQRVILLNKGKVVFDGNTEEGISKYIFKNDGNWQKQAYREYHDKNSPGNNQVRLNKVRILNSKSKETTQFDLNNNINIIIDYQIIKPIQNFHLYIKVFTQNGTLVFASASWDHNNKIDIGTIKPGSYQYIIKIPKHSLNKGKYFININGLIPGISFIFQEEAVISWKISNKNGAGGTHSAEREGIFRPLLNWKHSRIKSK